MKTPSLLFSKLDNTRHVISIYLLISFIISFALFGWTIAYGYFFSDDFTWLWHGAKILRGEIQVLTAHMSTFYSPVLNAFYAVMMYLFGPAPRPYFLFGLIVHSAAAAACGVFVSQLAQSKRWGMAAAVFVALAGSAYEPLVFIGANMHMFAALFILLACIGLAQALQQGKKRWLLLSFFAALLAFGSKEIAVITPVLVFALCIMYREKIRFLTRSRVLILSFSLYSASIIGLSLVYAWQQYLWQRQSVWIESGIWQPGAGKLLRVPLALFDAALPVYPYMSARSAPFFFIAACGILMVAVHRFRRQPLFCFGLLWAVISMLPVIFFQTNTWWQALPSRYAYTVRIGLIIALFGMIGALGQKWRRFALALAIGGALMHIGFFFRTARHEYGYVYRSGQTLAAAAHEIGTIKPARVLVANFRPFRANVAHIVGAMDVIARMPESSIVFLKPDDERKPAADEVLLYWNEKEKRYEVHAGAI